MSNRNIKNWKLVEILDQIEIVSYDSDDFFNYTIKKMDIPLTNYKSINRANTYINWSQMSEHYKFCFDKEGDEEVNKLALKQSKVIEKENVIMNYGFDDPAVLIPIDIFIEDWEDFFASVQYETIIISEDFELIMEISRDYNLHSNFKIR